jgi:hypothetical protein
MLLYNNRLLVLFLDLTDIQVTQAHRYRQIYLDHLETVNLDRLLLLF